MPKRRNAKKVRRRRGRRVVGKGRAPGPSDASPLPTMALHSILSGTRQVVKTTSDWIDIAELLSRPRELKEEKKAAPMVELKLLRGMFKADHPYQTRLGVSFETSTSAAGVVNASFNISTITSASEWSVINALFDEFFVHSCTLRFSPYNSYGAGYTAAGTTSGTVTSASNGRVTSTGLTVVSLYSIAGAYTTADAMLSNPTRKHVMSNEPWTYTWKNNVRFDPHGISMSSATTEAWQGWNFISNASAYGGSIQFRANHDRVLGDTTNALVLGSVVQTWLVSFRSRV